MQLKAKYAHNHTIRMSPLLRVFLIIAPVLCIVPFIQLHGGFLEFIRNADFFEFLILLTFLAIFLIFILGFFIDPFVQKMEVNEWLDANDEVALTAVDFQDNKICFYFNKPSKNFYCAYSHLVDFNVVVNFFKISRRDNFVSYVDTVENLELNFFLPDGRGLFMMWEPKKQKDVERVIYKIIDYGKKMNKFDFRFENAHFSLSSSVHPFIERVKNYYNYGHISIISYTKAGFCLVTSFLCDFLSLVAFILATVVIPTTDLAIRFFAAVVVFSLASICVNFILFRVKKRDDNMLQLSQMSKKGDLAYDLSSGETKLSNLPFNPPYVKLAVPIRILLLFAYGATFLFLLR